MIASSAPSAARHRSGSPPPSPADVSTETRPATALRSDAPAERDSQQRHTYGNTNGHKIAHPPRAELPRRHSAHHCHRRLHQRVLAARRRSPRAGPRRRPPGTTTRPAGTQPATRRRCSSTPVRSSIHICQGETLGKSDGPQIAHHDSRRVAFHRVIPAPVCRMKHCAIGARCAPPPTHRERGASTPAPQRRTAFVRPQ